MTVNALHPLPFGSPAEYLKQKSETLLYCQLEIRKLIGVDNEGRDTSCKQDPKGWRAGPRDKVRETGLWREKTDTLVCTTI